jgi:polyisoprenoid-binding protein YceI
MSASTLTFAPAGTWALDPTHSSVGFQVPYLAGTFKGQLHDVEGQLAVTDAGATLTGAARVASVDVKDENLNAHLQSPDFFDAERHPELHFAATDIDLDGDEVRVRGEIEIKGVRKPVEVTGTAVAPLTDGFGNERIGLALATTVDRNDFGVSWNMDLPAGGKSLGDEVKILAELYFVRADGQEA